MGEYTAPHVERPTVINPLRRRNRDRGLTPGQRDEVQKLVFELVQTRLIHAFGPRGMFTVTPHDPTAIDTFFAQAVADTIAWDVAGKLATPGAVSAPIEQVSAALSAAVAASASATPVPASNAPVAAAPVDTVSLDTAPMPVTVADAATEIAAEVATDASVSVDTAGVAIVTSRFAPPAPPMHTQTTHTQTTETQSTAASQVADARAKSAAASAPQKQLEDAGRQLVA